jgi:YbbR domain-containing protein
MKLGDLVRHNLGLKALSLLLAVLLWLFAGIGREREKGFTIPVLLENVPPGLQVAGNPPNSIDVRLRGPNILLWKIRAIRPAVRLDLSGATEGTTAFPSPAAMIDLPDGAKVTRVMPANIEVRLTKSAKHESGK